MELCNQVPENPDEVKHRLITAVAAVRQDPQWAEAINAGLTQLPADIQAILQPHLG